MGFISQILFRKNNPSWKIESAGYLFGMTGNRICEGYVGPFTHNHPKDRPLEIFDGQVTVHTGPKYPSHILLPVIPKR